MAVITINHIRRRQQHLGIADEERTEVAGEIRLPSGRTTLNVGTFKLSVMSAIILTPKNPRRGIFGSISSPNIYGKTVILAPTYAGTTGTRAVTGIGAIGSVTLGGTNSSYYFHAFGW